MTAYQIVFALAYKKCEEMLAVLGEDRPDITAPIIEEMLLIRYWYAGVDPNDDKDRTNAPPPPPPPPWWY